MTLRVGFLMEQNAGHLTNYRNIRSVIESEDGLDIASTWHELSYERPGGGIERVRERLPFVPPYVTCNSRMVYEFRRGMRDGPFDVVFTNSWAAIFAVGQMRRTPTMIDFDSTPIQIDGMSTYDGPDDNHVVSNVKFCLHRRAYGAATLLHAWSTWAKSSIVDDYGIPQEKVVVNPPGVDTAFFCPGERSKSDGKTRILFVGGDFRRKGGGLLLDWFTSYGRADIELHIATREPIAALPPGVTIYDGIDANSPELLELLHSSDVFVLPSLGECFGIATVEAMAAGLPVVTSDVGATADIVEDGGNGYITKAGDGRSLAQALSALVDDASLRARMGARSRTLATGRFDTHKNTLQLVEHLHHLGDPLQASDRGKRVASW